MKKNTVLIESKRITLRKFKIGDSKKMYQNWCSDGLVAMNAGWPKHESESDTKELVKFWVEEYKKENTFNWIICLKDGEPIGSITVVKNDLINKTCEMGYNIGRKFWNNGYATEAITEIVYFLFKNTKVETIYAECFDFNKASFRVLEKNGFKCDGILRNRYILNNKSVSLIEMSLLKEEFEKSEKN